MFCHFITFTPFITLSGKIKRLQIANQVKSNIVQPGSVMFLPLERTDSQAGAEMESFFQIMWTFQCSQRLLWAFLPNDTTHKSNTASLKNLLHKLGHRLFSWALLGMIPLLSSVQLVNVCKWISWNNINGLRKRLNCQQHFSCTSPLPATR